MYVDKQQDNQVEFLLIAQFAHNSAKTLATGFLPFFTNYGYKPRLGKLIDNLLSILEDARIKAE